MTDIDRRTMLGLIGAAASGSAGCLSGSNKREEIPSYELPDTFSSGAGRMEERTSRYLQGYNEYMQETYGFAEDLMRTQTDTTFFQAETGTIADRYDVVVDLETTPYGAYADLTEYTGENQETLIEELGQVFGFTLAAGLPPLRLFNPEKRRDNQVALNSITHRVTGAENGEMVATLESEELAEAYDIIEESAGTETSLRELQDLALEHADLPGDDGGLF